MHIERLKCIKTQSEAMVYPLQETSPPSHDCSNMSALGMCKQYIIATMKHT